MKRAQIIQYVAALLTFAVALLTDPEIREFLKGHPLTAVSLLAAPSFVTLLRASARVLRRGVPKATDPSEAKTNPIGVERP